MPRHLRLSPASTTASVPHHTPTAPKSSPRISALLQRIQAKPSELSPSEVLQLQRAVGNREVARLLKTNALDSADSKNVASGTTSSAPPIQRTIRSAAKALLENKNVKEKVTLAQLKKIAKEHGVDAEKHLEAVQDRLYRLRLEAAAWAIRDSGHKTMDNVTAKIIPKNLYIDLKTDFDGIKEELEEIVKLEKPIEEISAEKFINDLPTEKSGVMIEKEKIEVHLDNYQLKHQPPGKEYIIGTRTVSGGTLFKEEYASESWHKGHTLAYMHSWAKTLGKMKEGEVKQHGQMKNIDGIHYEGSCVFVKGIKYVLFHCYPHKNSEYDSGKKK